jgi:very-short-patch-repair endonuclease
MTPTDILALQLGPQWHREYRFAAEHVGIGKSLRHRLIAADLRDWRFDLALIARRIAVEVEGGGWVGGRHTRGAGFEQDLRKYAAAQRLGWSVVRVSPKMIQDGTAIATIREVLHHAP